MLPHVPCSRVRGGLVLGCWRLLAPHTEGQSCSGRWAESSLTTATLQRGLEGTVDDVQLLFARQAVEVHGVAAHADGQLGVLQGARRGGAGQRGWWRVGRGWVAVRGVACKWRCRPGRSRQSTQADGGSSPPHPPVGVRTPGLPACIQHHPTQPTFSGCSIASISVSRCSTLLQAAGRSGGHVTCPVPTRRPVGVHESTTGDPSRCQPPACTACRLLSATPACPPTRRPPAHMLRWWPPLPAYPSRMDTRLSMRASGVLPRVAGMSVKLRGCGGGEGLGDGEGVGTGMQ